MTADASRRIAVLTDREAAAVLFIVEAALPDEEPSEVRAALLRAKKKLLGQVRRAY